MKTQKTFVRIVCILILINSTSLNAAEKGEFSNTLNASTLIRIQADPSFLRIEDYESFNAICKPAYLQAFHDLYGDQKNEEKQDYEEGLEGSLATVDFLGSLEIPGPSIAIQGTININLYTLYNEYPLAAQEIKESFLNRLRENLNRAYEEYRQTLQGRQEAYEKQVAEAELRINELHKTLLDISGGKQMSREFLEEQITGLSNELREAEFRIRAGEQRIRLLEQQRGEAEARHHDKQTNDPILRELEKKIEPLETKLKHLQTMGTPPREEIQEIEQRLIEARIGLAERREMVNESPEAHGIRQIKEQLTGLSLERSERDMRVQFMHEQLQEIRGLLERSTEYETLRIKADVQRKALYESMEQLERIRRENNLLSPPILTVISQ